MKLTVSILIAFAGLHAQTASRSREFATGRDYYAATDFKKAAAYFQVRCESDGDAEACYWTGLSYERQADVSFPFGCRIDTKAHRYFANAMDLAPGRTLYRDAFFDFLLSTADCSRTALREAAGILSAVPESDPDYDHMRRRLVQESRFHGSADARLANLFLLIPRATYGLAVLPGALVRAHSGAASCGEADRNEACTGSAPSAERRACEALPALRSAQ